VLGGAPFTSAAVFYKLIFFMEGSTGIVRARGGVNEAVTIE